MDHTTSKGTLLLASSAEVLARMNEGEVVTLTLDLPNALLTLQALQFCLRELIFSDVSAYMARQVARDIERKLVRTPAIAEVVRRGWIPTEEKGKNGK